MTAHNWVFRVASRPEYGGGHVRRCLVLAHAMKPVAQVTFALDHGGGKWRDDIAAAGFDAVADEEGTESPVAGVVVDHCDPEPTIVARWRKRARRLVVFCDGGEAIDGADLEIRQWDPPSAGTRGALSGPDYALVDRAFTEMENAPLLPLPAHVLVAFGLRDSPNATAATLAALRTLAARWRPQITVALGADAPNISSVQEKLEWFGDSARLLLGVPSLRDALLSCDLVIGAGGVSAAERAAAGRASLTLTLNASQEAVAQMLESLGATVNLGPVQRLDGNQLVHALWQIAADPRRRNEMALAGPRAIDGMGPQRIADALVREALG